MAESTVQKADPVKNEVKPRSEKIEEKEKVKGRNEEGKDRHPRAYEGRKSFPFSKDDRRSTYPGNVGQAQKYVGAKAFVQVLVEFFFPFFDAQFKS